MRRVRSLLAVVFSVMMFGASCQSPQGAPPGTAAKARAPLTTFSPTSPLVPATNDASAVLWDGTKFRVLVGAAHPFTVSAFTLAPDASVLRETAIPALTDSRSTTLVLTDAGLVVCGSGWAPDGGPVLEWLVLRDDDSPGPSSELPPGLMAGSPSDLRVAWTSVGSDGGPVLLDAPWHPNTGLGAAHETPLTPSDSLADLQFDGVRYLAAIATVDGGQYTSRLEALSGPGGEPRTTVPLPVTGGGVPRFRVRGDSALGIAYWEGANARYVLLQDAGVASAVATLGVQNSGDFVHSVDRLVGVMGGAPAHAVSILLTPTPTLVDLGPIQAPNGAATALVLAASPSSILMVSTGYLTANWVGRLSTAGAPLDPLRPLLLRPASSCCATLAPTSPPSLYWLAERSFGTDANLMRSVALGPASVGTELVVGPVGWPSLPYRSGRDGPVVASLADGTSLVARDDFPRTLGRRVAADGGLLDVVDRTVCGWTSFRGAITATGGNWLAACDELSQVRLNTLAPSGGVTGTTTLATAGVLVGVAFDGALVHVLTGASSGRLQSLIDNRVTLGGIVVSSTVLRDAGVASIRALTGQTGALLGWESIEQQSVNLVRFWPDGGSSSLITIPSMGTVSGWNGLALSDTSHPVAAWSTNGPDGGTFLELAEGQRDGGFLLSSAPVAGRVTSVIEQDGGLLVALEVWAETAPQTTVQLVVVTQNSNGTPCSSNFDCASRWCVDGVCCNEACGGPVSDCLACSASFGAALNGVCGPITAGTLCRAAVDACDVADLCNGVSASCADTRVADGGVCLGDQRCLQNICTPRAPSLVAPSSSVAWCGVGAGIPLTVDGSGPLSVVVAAASGDAWDYDADAGVLRGTPSAGGSDALTVSATGPGGDAGTRILLAVDCSADGGVAASDGGVDGGEVASAGGADAGETVATDGDGGAPSRSYRVGCDCSSVDPAPALLAALAIASAGRRRRTWRRSSEAP